VFEKLRHGFRQPGASPAKIEECEAKLRITLPDDHKAFLTISNGFNDEVGQGDLVIWSIEELLWADEYELFERQPRRFLIGSNGGPTACGIIDGNYISIRSYLPAHGRPDCGDLVGAEVIFPHDISKDCRPCSVARHTERAVVAETALDGGDLAGCNIRRDLDLA
jgi:hypothetical protein